MQHLKDTFIQALNEEKYTQKDFAIARGIEPSHVTKFIKTAKTLTPEMKAAIFIGWESEALQIALFDAHIKDEIEAAGLTGQIRGTCYNAREEDES